jgi:hypothetical protein
MSLLKDLEQYLIDKNIAVADGTDLFRDAVPETPDRVIVLSEYGSMPMTFGDASVSRSVQVIVRDTSYAGAEALAWQVFKAFINPLENIVDVTSSRWGIFTARQTPHKLLLDEKGRTQFFFNMGIVTTMD